MHSMLRGHVSVCVCVRMCVWCVLFSTACVSCFWLGAEPCPMIGFTAPVMSRRAQCRNEKAAVFPCSGNVFFQTTGMFSAERGWLLDCIVQQLCNTKIDFILPRDLFYLLPSFLPVALVILIHNFYQ
ncbi:hypothetical protein INR49_023287 [Caranx melampygus]|nr:hypothetical protein INR49_023287 [Caranx melampygus]